MTRNRLLLAVVAIALVIGILWLRSCAAERKAKDRAATAEKAREADAAAGEQRATDQAEIANDTKEITDALAPLPDAPLTDRQRARACAVWLRQHGSPATGC